MARARGGTVHVIGSINQDLVALVRRHPRPGETVAGSGFERLPGGKGLNQAVAAARAGARVAFIGAVGEDPDGSALLATLAAEGVDISNIVPVPLPTGVALVTVDQHGENVIVVVPGANASVTVSAAAAVPARAGDVVVAQLEVPLDVVAAGMQAAQACGARALLNAAPAQELHEDALGDVDLLIVNQTELDALGGMAQVRARLRPSSAVIATLGADGAVVAEGRHEEVIAGRRVEVVDSTGAGDCFVGVLAASLASGSSLVDAAETANVAASLAVRHRGAASSMPRADQIAAARAELR